MVLWMATKDFVLPGQERKPSWKKLLMEISVNNGQCKDRAEIRQAASQEQGQPPAGRSCPMIHSADRGKEVGRLSALRAELKFQPQLLAYTPNVGGGGEILELP